MRASRRRDVTASTCPVVAFTPRQPVLGTRFTVGEASGDDELRAVQRHAVHVEAVAASPRDPRRTRGSTGRWESVEPVPGARCRPTLWNGPPAYQPPAHAIALLASEPANQSIRRPTATTRTRRCPAPGSRAGHPIVFLRDVRPARATGPVLETTKAVTRGRIRRRPPWRTARREELAAQVAARDMARVAGSRRCGRAGLSLRPSRSSRGFANTGGKSTRKGSSAPGLTEAESGLICGRYPATQARSARVAEGRVSADTCALETTVETAWPSRWPVRKTTREPTARSARRCRAISTAPIRPTASCIPIAASAAKARARALGAHQLGRGDRHHRRAFTAIAASPDGPQAICPYSYAGTMGRSTPAGMDRRFFHRLGASLLDRTLCSSAGKVGIEITLGGSVGMDPERVEDARLS